MWINSFDSDSDGRTYKFNFGVSSKYSFGTYFILLYVYYNAEGEVEWERERGITTQSQWISNKFLFCFENWKFSDEAHEDLNKWYALIGQQHEQWNSNTGWTRFFCHLWTKLEIDKTLTFTWSWSEFDLKPFIHIMYLLLLVFEIYFRTIELRKVNECLMQLIS